MLACLVASGCNLLLLDEPVNHLDIPRASVRASAGEFLGTVIAAVHDASYCQLRRHPLEIREKALVLSDEAASFS